MWKPVTDKYDARIKYDAGTHELAQKVTNGKCVPMIYKLRRPVARNPYFVHKWTDSEGVTRQKGMYHENWQEDEYV